jgi:hypothetical protein
MKMIILQTIPICITLWNFLHPFKFEDVQNPHKLFEGYNCSCVLALRYASMEFN